MLKKMRQCRLNFAENRYDCEAGIIGEHNATELIVTPPVIMPSEAVYRLCFEPGGLSEIILQTTDGTFSYPLPSAVTATPYCCVTLIGYVGGEQIYKSRMVRLHFSQTAGGDADIDPQQPGIIAEVNRNTAARHTHDNEAILDKFAESDGQPTYDGQALGGGGSTGTELFVVDVQVESGEEYTVTSHNKTYAQIDEAYKAGKQILAVCTITSEDTVYLIPLIFATETDYTFSVFAGANFYIYVDSTDTWDISIDYLEASTIKAKLSDDASAKSSSLQYILNYMVYPAVEKAHEHSNETVLDRLSDSSGKLLYNGTEAGLKGEKGDPGAKGADGKTPVKGTDYWTAADKQEIIDDIHPAYYIDLTGTYPNYTCPVAMDDIKAAYNSGYNLVCRCTLGVYTATLPLFVPMPVANTWIFSGSGALASMNFGAQSLTVAITADGVAAQNYLLTNKQLNITVDGVGTYQYDGSNEVNVEVKSPARLVTTIPTESGIVYLTDNTEYRLADITTLTLNYPAGEFECWMRLSFAESGNITVTLPAGTKYIGTAPDFKNGEIWEMSIKDGVVIAQKVGDGT